MIIQMALLYFVHGASAASTRPLSARVAGRTFTCTVERSDDVRTMRFDARGANVYIKSKYFNDEYPVTWRRSTGQIDYAQDLEKLEVRDGQLHVDVLTCLPLLGD